MLSTVNLHPYIEDVEAVHLLIDLCEGGDLLTGAAGTLRGSGASFDDADRAEAGSFDDADAAADAAAAAGDRAEPDGDGDGGRSGSERWAPFSEAMAVPAIRSMLRALAACHEHGVVHRHG